MRGSGSSSSEASVYVSQFSEPDTAEFDVSTEEALEVWRDIAAGGGQGVSGGEKKSRDMGRGGGAMRLRRVLVSDSALE